MPPMQPVIGSLRGFGVFTRVITRGKRYEKSPIKAFICSSPSTTTSLRIGYTVTRKIRKAIHRNRLKRMMRAAFRTKKEAIVRQADKKGLFEIVFMYNDTNDIDPTRVQFSSINQAFENICSIILKG
jgi:ribonuclease P protein component